MLNYAHSERLCNTVLVVNTRTVRCIHGGVVNEPVTMNWLMLLRISSILYSHSVQTFCASMFAVALRLVEEMSFS